MTKDAERNLARYVTAGLNWKSEESLLKLDLAEVPGNRASAEAPDNRTSAEAQDNRTSAEVPDNRTSQRTQATGLL